MNVYNFLIITVLWDSYMSTKQRTPEDNFHRHSCENVCRHTETKQMNEK